MPEAPTPEAPTPETSAPETSTPETSTPGVPETQTPDFSDLPTQAHEVLARLDALGIAHETLQHPPVFTVEEAKHVRELTRGGHVKNLFLRNKKGAMWLITLMEDKRVDLKALGEILNAGKLSFASPQRLKEFLGVYPGSVTALAIINDTAGQVALVLDQDLFDHETINVHPLRNDQTTNLRTKDLVAFAKAQNHMPAVIEIPQRISS